MSELLTARELDTRDNDGLVVRLLWHEQEDSITVAVTDTRGGESFNIPVREGQRPLDVFHHPYAYAAGNVAVRSAREDAQTELA